MSYTTEIKEAHEKQKALEKIAELSGETLEVSLLLKYVPFILKRVQAKFVKHHGIYLYEDLLDAAIVGALKAEKRFDKKRGIDFSTYARKDIDGSMDNFVKQNTRTQIVLHKRILQFVEDYVKEHSMFPSESEIIKAVGITHEKYRELLSDMEPLQFIPYMVVHENGDEEELGIDELHGEHSIILEDVHRLLKNLTEEQQKIITWTCINEASIMDVALALKCTQSQAQSKIAQAKDDFKEILIHNGISL